MKLVRLQSEQCTIEWLAANKHRLYMLPPEKIAEFERDAAEAANTPEHTEGEDCERCAKEDELEVMITVRKVPRGERPPRFRFTLPRLASPVMQ